MTGAYALAVGDRELSVEGGAPSWACTGCLACTEACDHRNPVAATLFESRAALMERGLAPAAAREVVERHAEREAEAARAADALGAAAPDGDAPLLVIGCVYLREFPETAGHALEVARALLGTDVRVYGGCCGLPLLHAGDRSGFDASVARLTNAARGSRLVVVDPGCAYALGSLAGANAPATPPNANANANANAPRVELLLDLAAGALDRFRPGSAAIDAPTYHDPCSLGRGLGRYDEPRAILTHLVGQPPREFVHARDRALCSGAGALLPVTMPEVSATITRTRVADRDGDDAPAIATACASSLLAFRRAGKVAYDLCDLLARGLGDGASPV
jgi:Fe-S oxidoreductase